MSFSYQLLNHHTSVLGKNWGWLLLWGILLTALGIFAMGAATFTTIVSVILIGMLIFASGVIITLDTIKFWWGNWSGFFLHLIVGVIYLIVGAMLIESPIEGSISLTFILGVFYVLIGIFRITYSLSIRSRSWGFGIVNGLVSLLLGILILASWPASSLFIIGLFVGIDLLVSGVVYIMVALSGKKLLMGR